MHERLDRLAESHGIQLGYVSEMGERQVINDEAKLSLLKALGVDPENGPEGSFEEAGDKPTSHCALPESIRTRRSWGVACQLYSLRSDRNLGMGDFEDLANFAQIAGEAGASFVGVNPLHALFMADAGRFSPYSPSSRRFVNPLYIAIDRLAGGPEAIAVLREREPAAFAVLDGDLVEYAAVGVVKNLLLREVFLQRLEALRDDEAFEAYCAGGGEALRDFALFEAISARQVAAGSYAGWHSWPEELRSRDLPAVHKLEAEAADEILFHLWLQYTAEEQLAEAQVRAKGAGMRIGLYLDLAVGVSPDGAETWSDPELTVGAARVGSPPDMFNSTGQDWGLAPLSPKALAEREYKPLGDSFDALTRHAGAVRIDHVMGLARLWWIAEGHISADGGYVRYPLGKMLDTIAEASNRNDCLVIGEDLGTVPPGFRATLSEANLLSYRVLYFERNGIEFLPTSAYPELSLACVSTHDLPTLKGWWLGTDLDLRAETGRQSPERTAEQREERKRDRRMLIAALKEAGVLPEAYDRVASGEDPLPVELAQDIADAVHRFLARAPSLLVTVQIEDMVGSARQPNLPGTTNEYPNWRIRSAVRLEELAANGGFQSTARAMRDERPETV